MLPPTALPWFAMMFVTIAALRSQVAWQQVTSAVGPSARTRHAAALEPGGQVLLFGGLAAGTTFRDDTWLFDGLMWTQAQPGTHPPHRSGHRLVHDLVRGRLVLFGGDGVNLSPNALHDDTWEWNGTSWLERFPAHRPPARRDHGMAFHQPSFRTVLFGGMGTVFRDDTWKWDGFDWTPVVTAVSPSARHSANLAADVVRNQLVLFGGLNSSGAKNDTWEYDGQDWLQRHPATTPSARHSPGLVYDLARGRIVMFGGSTHTYLGPLADVWEWNGIDWQQRMAAGAAPLARHSMAMAADMYGGLSLMHGGSGSSMLLADSFTYAGTAPGSFAPYGIGCGGGNGVPSLLPVGGRAPWIGDTWTLQLAPLPADAPALVLFGNSRTAWGPTLLPMSLTGYGLPGCTLFVSPDASRFTVASTQIATWPIAIPSNEALVGMTMYAQAAGMDLAANPGGLVVGNALEVTFGGR